MQNDENETYWFELKYEGFGKEPYKRTVGYHPGTDEIYLSTEILGNSITDLLAMSNDRIELLKHNNYFYCPATWFKDNYPQYSNEIRGFIDILKQEFKNDALVKQISLPNNI